MLGLDSMTAAKIAITMSRPLLAQVRSAVKRGEAVSVSAFVSQALDQYVREESLARVLESLIEKRRGPTEVHRAGTSRALPCKRR